MFGYTAFPSIYGPSLTGIAGTARAHDCLRPGFFTSLDTNRSLKRECVSEVLTVWH
jgi:hypothetical protein